jgi:flagellar biosynthetic protein FlhB
VAEEDDGNKTEEPSQKRLDDAREKGQIASSREINHWFMFLASTLAIFLFGPAAFRDFFVMLQAFFEAPHAFQLDTNAVIDLLSTLLLKMALALWPIIALLMAGAFAAGYLQAGPLMATDQIMPKWEKISPLAGVKRLFSSRSLVEFAKGLLKIGIVGGISWYVVRDEFDRLERFTGYDMAQLLAVLNELSLRLMGAVLAIMTVIAALDFAYQKFQLMKSLRMSREDMREEYKQQEGDPMVKGRLKQIRLERARRRMMAEVPKADVVITNPTHFAVALRYDQNAMGAPRVVAKGVDLVARRIREIAEESKVPIVENPPLARALYAAVELDQEIPPEHYKAVAKVISYVMAMRGRRPRPQAAP